ncbi:DUF3050 domain-containing protein [Nonomuraea endophytica]|uniref:DUF3050 domain-containing protein n=1 Tax=Nonomuraea endophytica TaxID=714136 RepID=UPI0037CBDA95
MALSRYHFDHDHAGLIELKKSITSVRSKVLAHDVYRSMVEIDDVTTFMEYHVFAVWDFMSLLKSLQLQLTCVGVPWIPQGPTACRRLINEIVLVEESDEFADGYISHFELYLHGMRQAGANAKPMEAFIKRLRGEIPVPQALQTPGIPEAAAKFVATTWRILDGAPVHCQAAAFAFGREDLIPEMFEQVIRIDDHSGKLTHFKDYLARHIEVDADEHTPMAMRMLIDLCGDDDRKWTQCADTVTTAMEARLALWDAIHNAIMAGRSHL